MLYQSALDQVSIKADCIGPYQPQVPGVDFGLGVRWRLALTSGVPERTRGGGGHSPRSPPLSSCLTWLEWKERRACVSSPRLPPLALALPRAGG